MNKFERMQTFMLVAESHSFAEVARKMNVTTAAVSKQILMLETHLGLQLLNRSTRSHSVSLTEAGKVYLENCRRIISDVIECEDVISNMKSEPAGTLNLFAVADFAEEFIMPHLGEYLAKYPKVNVKLEMKDRFPDLSREDIDVFAGVSLLAPPELASINLNETRHITVASADYLKKHGAPKTPESLSEHTLLNHYMREDVFYFKRDSSIQLPAKLLVNSTHGLITAAKEGLGIAQLPDYIAKDAIASGELKEVLSTYREPANRLRLFYRKSRFMQPKISTFVEFLTTKVK